MVPARFSSPCTGTSRRAGSTRCLAWSRRTGSRCLRLLMVLDAPSVAFTSLLPAARRALRRRAGPRRDGSTSSGCRPRVGELINALSFPPEVHRVRVWQSDPGRAIVARAALWPADVVIVGRDGRSRLQRAALSARARARRPTCRVRGARRHLADTRRAPRPRVGHAAGGAGRGPRVTPPVLFPFAEYWWLYAVFTAGVLGLLALDLGVVHRGARAVSVREAAGWSAVWVSLALVFNAMPLPLRAPDARRRYAPGGTRIRSRRGGLADRAGVLDRLPGRVLAVGRQHLRLRAGAPRTSRSRRACSIASCSTASSARWCSAACSSRWARC